jgi:hypothetical protein
VAAILGSGLSLGMAALVPPIGQVLIIETLVPFILFHRVSLRKGVVLMLLARVIMALAHLLRAVQAYRCHSHSPVCGYIAARCIRGSLE